MQPQILQLSSTTKTRWSEVGKKAEDLEKSFVEVYKTSLDELIPGWKTQYKKWDSYNWTIGMVDEILIHQACSKGGMKSSTFEKYAHAARAHLFAGLDFNLARRISKTKLNEITKLADADKSDRDRDIKINEAAQKIVKRHDKEKRERRVSETATILHDPENNETASDYLIRVFSEIQQHFNKENVQKLIGKNRKVINLLRAVEIHQTIS